MNPRKPNFQIQHSKNQIDRETAKLITKRNQIAAQIKTLAKSGRHAEAKQLSKTYAQYNSQIQKMQGMSGQMIGMKNKIIVAESNNKLADAMGAAGKAMQIANTNLNQQNFQEKMKNMMKQDQMLQMKQEMMEDGLEMFSDNMYDKQEADDIYQQVLEEAGVNTANMFKNAEQKQYQFEQPKKMLEGDDFDYTKYL